MAHLSGVFAPIVTPFQLDSTSIDYAWIPYLLSYLRKQGLDGVVPIGTTSEGTSLSLHERKTLLDTVMARKGNLRVVAGVGTPSLTETIELTRHAFASGVDSVLVLPPYYWRSVSDKGLLHYFRTLCDRALEPGQKIMLYHIPQISGVPITLTLLDGLMETHAECILGLKDSTGNANSLVQFVRRYPTLRIFVGSDRLVAFAYQIGAAGSITACANLVPAAIQRIRTKVQRGEDVEEDQAALDALRELLDEYPPLQASIKVLLTRLAHVPLTFVRPPLVNLTPHQRAELLEKARGLKILVGLL